MLVFTRYVNETVIITAPDGSVIEVTLLEVRGNKTRIGFTAPKEFTVHRGEIQKEIDKAKK